MQADTESALGTELRGYTAWTIEAQLLALISDQLAVGNWQRAGKKNAPRPKPIERPWKKPAGQKFGSDAIPVSQFNDWWDA